MPGLGDLLSRLNEINESEFCLACRMVLARNQPGLHFGAQAQNFLRYALQHHRFGMWQRKLPSASRTRS
jgi:hypothetical protein